MAFSYRLIVVFMIMKLDQFCQEKELKDFVWKNPIKPADFDFLKYHIITQRVGIVHENLGIRQSVCVRGVSDGKMTVF